MMNNNLAQPPNSRNASPERPNILRLSLVSLSLVLYRPPLAKAAERDVMMATAAILRDKGFNCEEIASALAGLVLEPWNQLTAKELTRYERYKTLSTDPWEVLTKLIGTKGTNQFKHFLEKTPSSPMADGTKGVQPC